MAKRFADTRLSRERWYRVLKPGFKCGIRFIFDECDEAGVWPIDEEEMEFYVGERVPLQELIEEANKDGKVRLRLISKDKLFIPEFALFQYGELSDACKPHKKSIKRLKELNLWEEYLERLAKPYPKVKEGYLGRVQEEEEEEDKEEDKEEEGDKKKEEKRDAGKTEAPPPPKAFPDSVRACIATWKGTLEHFGITREMSPAEQETIARAVQNPKWGAEFVDLALYGARFEPKIDDFNPRDHVALDRIFLPTRDGKPPRIEKFANWGDKGRKAEAAEQARRAKQEVEEVNLCEPHDPERVRAIIASAFPAAGLTRRMPSGSGPTEEELEARRQKALKDLDLIKAKDAAS